MKPEQKRELRDSYKAKPVTGGVCCIRCSGNGRVCIQSTRNIEGLRHRYDFAISIGSSPDPTLQSEFVQYGVSSFSFSVLDELKKGEDQTDREFAADIDALYEMWREKQQNGEPI